jgi:coupling of ubiquitin conjugation to ER degradation protein 1
MADQINFPQLLLVLIFSGLALRYFFFSSSASNTENARNSNAAAIRAREADIERILQMFPQVSRREIMWNLQRDGGNVAATTERILGGRGLETVSAFAKLLVNRCGADLYI